MFTKIIVVLTFTLFSAASVFAQEDLQTAAAAPPNLETVLTEAQKQTLLYKQTFRDLLALETKTFEEFDKKGSVDKKTTVKSDFLVYQSGKNSNVTTELRNVVEVNGKLVPNSQKRSSDFLAELGKTTTLESELKKIQKEGSKYDKTLEVYGLTLNEGVVLAPNIRPYFDFQMTGTENYQDNEVFVINYRQTKKSPYSVVNGDENVSNEASLYFEIDVPDALEKTDVFLTGKLWIDAKTFQIRREDQSLVYQTAEPLIALTNTFEYQTSDYGILVPKLIVVTFFDLKKQKGSDKFASQKDTAVSFEYSKFRQTNVEVQILDDVE